MFGLYIVAKPKVSSADFINLLSTVFKNKEIKHIEEIEQINKSSQTMAVLAAPISPESAASNAVGVGKNSLSSGSSTNGSITEGVIEGSVLVSEKKSAVSGIVGIDGYSNDRISLYTVHTGDTIEQIAKMYGVTASTILWANDLKKGSTLKKDQVLVILPISGIKYTVKKGDTLAKIASYYKGDAREIALFNNLYEDQALTAGDEIIIPDIEVSLADGELNKQNSKENKAKNAKNSKSGKNSNVKNGKDTTGYFMRPVSGGTKTQGLHGHNGIDIAAPLGTSILAAASGQVILSRSGGWGGGYGTYVVIQHSNGMQTLYGHLSEALVSSGDTVQKGQVIGKMGNTGQSTGVHLHFEVRGGRNPF